MRDEKEYVFDVFRCLYCYMYEVIQTDNKYNVKNWDYLKKILEDMAYAFADSEDASRINWKRMGDFLSCLEMLDKEAEDKETEVSQEVFAKYKDIDMFFGILYQCMMIFVADDKVNKGNIMFTKNIFEKTREKFKKPKYAYRIPWDWMWQVLMNSEVYSMVVEMEQKNRGDSYLEKDLYSGNERFLDSLIYEDTKERLYSYFVCVIKSDYIGFDIPNASGKDSLKGPIRKFKEIIQKLDREEQIEKVFTYYKEGGKRLNWEVSAVDAKAFYKEMAKMDSFSTLGYNAQATLYSKFCSEKGWEASYKKIKELIECFAERGDCSDWYKEYKRLDRAAEILCQLVPMVSYRENGSRYIKTYSRWREDCEKIIGIVHEKTLALGMDQVELKAAELVRSYMHELSENAYEKSVQVCFKEQYLELLAEQSEKFFQSLDRVYLALENVDNEKDRAEIAKSAIKSLKID